MSRIATCLIAGFWACAISSAPHLAQAQSGPSQVKAVTLHFINGMKFDVPKGWSFSELSGGSVTLHYGTGEKAFAKENRNRFLIGRSLSPNKDVDNSYDRLDRQGNQTLPGGTKVRWYAGPRFKGIHYGFSAQIEARYSYLTMSILDRPTPAFSPQLVEQAILAIARSVRRTEFHRTFYHPAGMQVALANDQWFSRGTESAIRFGCFPVYCGEGSNAWLYAYRSSVAFKTDADALKDITGHWEKQEKLKIGATRRLALAGGMMMWTEQPGTARPLLGIVRRSGKYYFVAAHDLGKTQFGLDGLRPHYLQLAAGLRPWDAR